MIGSGIAAAFAAVAFGLGSVAQQAGVRHAPGRRGVGWRLVADLVRQPLFLLGTVLDAAGFVLTFLAARDLPVFVVEAVVAAAVAVTAVAARHWLGAALATLDRLAVVAVVGGLALIACSAEPAPALSPGSPLGPLLVAALPVLLGVGRLTRRWDGAQAAVALAALSGVAFGALALSGRAASDGPVMTEPMTWVAGAYAVVGLMFYGAALQHGRVTAIAAVTTVAEVLAPAAVGLLLADRTRPGFAGVAALGFTLTVGAVLVLATRAAPGTAERSRPESGRSPASRPQRGDPNQPPSTASL